MDQKSEELAAVVAEIRRRVRAQHPNGAVLGDIALPDLAPLMHARDAAEGKVASIGTVNPRRGGIVNSAIQSLKRMVSRALNWHVREQVEFNRAVMACVQATLEALNESNRTMVAFSARLAAVAAAEMPQQFNDLRAHWSEWRVEWEHKLALNEITMLRTLADLQAAFQHRVTLMDAAFRDQIKAQHSNYEGALARASADIQKQVNQMQEQFWVDFKQIRSEYEAMIHAELRLLRQRTTLQAASLPESTPVRPAAQFHDIDWLKFAEKFRGSEAAIKQRQQLYAVRFQGHAPVLDLGCGRGEMLEVLRAAGISSRGIDLSDENVALCHSKGLDAERADLFEYLTALPDASLGGAVSCQVVEHLPPERLPELIRLLHTKLRSGGLVAIETPNPECLAIFATHFYLDPTHRHPLPPALLAFYLEEAGFGRIEVERLSPAVETMPALRDLPAGFRQEFFGCLDYAVFAHKLG